MIKAKKLVYYYKPNRVDIKGDSIIHYGYLFVGSNYLDEPIYTLVNKPLSNLALEKYTGGIITNDSLIGKPTIIDLWYTNCAPCIKEIPILNKIKEKYGNSLHYKAITFENKKTIKRFLKKHNFTFDILINGQEFLDSMGNSSYPKLMVIDKDNIIRYLDLSIPEPENDFSNRYNEFIDLIDTLLKQKKT